MAVDGLKHGIINRLALYQEEISECVEKEIDRAISSFDFERAVRNAVRAVINDVIKAYFTNGDGYKTIKKTVESELIGLSNK